MTQGEASNPHPKRPHRTSKSESKNVTSDSSKTSEQTSSTDDAETIFDDRTCKTYVIGKFLGKGAHARVYEASDIKEPAQLYAIKLMAIEPDHSKPNRQRNGVREVRLNQVLREVEMHSAMHHVNVVKLESYFKQEIRFCIVMEHCEGNTLAQLLDTIGHMGENSSRDMLRQLLDGLEHIHSRGIIHRDLKPANIYLTREMVIKIGDFGLADRVGSGRKGICGTPNYISPEALLEHGYTPAVDIWAVGCIAYHMLAGRPPFDAASQATTYDLIRNHRFTPLSSTQACAGARHLIHWMLSFLPEERPSISFIRSHLWMKRKPRVSATRLRHRARKRESAPIAQKLDEITTTSSGSSAIQENIDSVKYERLSEKVSEASQENEAEQDNSKRQPFWRNVLERVKLKRMPSFQFIPSKMLGMRSKSVMNRISRKQSNLKRHLEQVLKVPPLANAQDCGCEVNGDEVPIFICKWIDYSNKFGFGYQMTDGSTGVIFNDQTQIFLDGNLSQVKYITTSERSIYPLHSVPASLEVKLTLLENFKEYMDTQLSCGMPCHSPAAEGQYVNNWYRSDKAIVFHSNSLLQVNFFEDHTKFILSSDDYPKTASIVTIDDDKRLMKYDFVDLKKCGCPESLHDYLVYIHSIL